MWLLLLVSLGRVRPSCDPRREAALRYLFDEVRRVSGGDRITLEMMQHYEQHVPRFGRWTVKHLLGGKGINYILERCRGDDGHITLESSLSRHQTCISKCIFARMLRKFLDWGYADYWST